MAAPTSDAAVKILLANSELCDGTSALAKATAPLQRGRPKSSKRRAVRRSTSTPSGKGRATSNCWRIGGKGVFDDASRLDRVADDNGVVSHGPIFRRAKTGELAPRARAELNTRSLYEDIHSAARNLAYVPAREDALTKWQ